MVTSPVMNSHSLIHMKARYKNLIALSNRGPLSYSYDADEKIASKRGAGGLVSILGPALANSGGRWIAAAASDADRVVATQADVDPLGKLQSGDLGYSVQLLALDEITMAGAMRTANELLWFAHHDLWNRPRSPRIDDHTWADWEAFRAYNEAFATAAADAVSALEPSETCILVQDYHLCLVPEFFKSMQPDVALVHFSHTPFATGSALAPLPLAWTREILASLAAADLCGFHTQRWADNFTSALAAFAPEIKAPKVGVFPIGPDAAGITEASQSSGVAQARAQLEDRLEGRRAIVRVDRAELSKNVLRGLEAFDLMLKHRPELAESVAHIVLLNPSRLFLQEYRNYLDDCVALASVINARYNREVILLYTEDDFARSMAGLSIADVIVVNALCDGMNLVAKEGPLVNKNDAPLILSSGAGAHEELGDYAITINPFDTRELSLAMETALELPKQRREETARHLRKRAGANSPTHWLQRQLEEIS